MNENPKCIETNEPLPSPPPLDRMVTLVGDMGGEDQKICTFQLTTPEAEKFREFLELLPSLQKSHSDYYKTESSNYNDVAESLLEATDEWKNKILSSQMIDLGIEVLEWEVIPIDIHTIISVDIYELGNAGQPIYKTMINDSRYTPFNEKENI